MRINAFRALFLGTLAMATIAGCGLPQPSLLGTEQAGMDATSRKAGWTAFPDAGVARRNAAGIAVGYFLFVLGGQDESGATLGKTECFKAFDTWTDKAAMPTPRSNLAAAVVPSNRVLALGGLAAGGVTAAAELYGMDQGTWERLPNMPTARADAGAASRGVFAYVAGGQGQAGLSKAFEVFDIRDRSWKQLADMPTARAGCVAATLGQRVAVVGGRTANGATGVLELYNPETGTWSQGAPMPTARSNAAFAIYGHHLFVLGGRTSNGVTDVVESYDLAANQWTTRAALPQPLQGAVASKLGERLVVTGGTSNGRPSSKTWGMPFPF